MLATRPRNRPLCVRPLLCIDKVWMKHTLSWMATTNDKVKLDYRPVHYYTLDEAEVKVVAPVARVY